MAKQREDDAPVDTGRWLNTYADLMNNLLVLFIAMYAMSIMDLEKFKAMAQQFNETLGGPPSSVQAAGPASSSNSNESSSGSPEEQFDDLYKKIKEGLSEKGYEDVVTVDKNGNIIHILFRESVLFLPDSPVMKEAGSSVLQFVGDTIGSADHLVKSIEIGGHTAKVGEDSTTNFFPWELSSDRAVTVLKFLVQKCTLPQAKMTVSGYSHYKPVGDNTTEEQKAINRRVEIRISRIDSP